MTSDRGVLEVVVKGDISNFQRAMRASKGDIEQLQRAVGTSGQSISATFRQVDADGARTSSTLGNLASSGVALGAGFLAAQASIETVIGFISSSVAAFTEAEDASVRLGAVLRASGNSAGASREELQAYASELQHLTGVDDETIQSSEAVIAAIAGSGAQVKEATGLALDLSKALGIDLHSASLALAKALESPAEGLTALQRVGVRFSEAEKDQIKALVEGGQAAEAQGVILDKLRGKVGGVAEEMGKTTSGQLAAFRAGLNDLQEIIGGKLVAAFKPMLEDLKKWAESDDAVKTTKDLADAMGTLATATAQAARFTLWLKDNWADAIPGLSTGLSLLSSLRKLKFSAPDNANRFLLEHPEAQTEADAAGRGAGNDWLATLAGANSRAMGNPNAVVPVKTPEEQAKLAAAGLEAQQRFAMDAMPSLGAGMGKLAGATASLEDRFAEAVKITDVRNLQLAHQQMEAAELAAAEATKKLAEAAEESADRMRATLGYLQGLGQRNVRFAPGVLESIAAGGGLSLADGSRPGTVDVVVP